MWLDITFGESIKNHWVGLCLNILRMWERQTFPPQAASLIISKGGSAEGLEDCLCLKYVGESGSGEVNVHAVESWNQWKPGSLG